MNKIILIKLKLKTFTEQNALDYCLLNNINPDNITELTLFNNELTDISGVKLFKNLEHLVLSYNLIKNISIVQYLNNLEYLNISYNKISDISVIKNLKDLKTLNIKNLLLKSNQIKYIKSLKILFCSKGFKDISVLNELNKNIGVFK